MKEAGLLREGAQVLHIAPEACFIPQLTKLLGSGYVTTDLESPLAKVKADIHALPFGDENFDLVLCNHVLEHVRDDIAAMKEIRRVLKPGGQAILQVPFFSPVPDVTQEDASVTSAKAREDAYGQSDHVRRYGRDYPKRITSSGLRPELVHFAHNLTDEQISRYGLAAGEVLHLGFR
jgi:ubiquinone/menaquinone biosynthesis C-methylase UbiE